MLSKDTLFAERCLVYVLRLDNFPLVEAWRQSVVKRDTMLQGNSNQCRHVVDTIICISLELMHMLVLARLSYASYDCHDVASVASLH